MERLNTLWKVVNAASTVKDIAQHTRTYHFAVSQPVTFYMQAENAGITLIRWSRPTIEITAKLQASFGWRVAAEQDDAGVYFVAKRRTVVGGLSSAAFEIRVPQETYTIFKFVECGLTLKNLDGTIQLAPPAQGDEWTFNHGGR
jgi:hypothetical protein